MNKPVANVDDDSAHEEHGDDDRRCNHEDLPSFVPGMIEPRRHHGGHPGSVGYFAESAIPILVGSLCSSRIDALPRRGMSDHARNGIGLKVDVTVTVRGSPAVGPTP